jgi:hypothetical protein
MIDGGHRPEKLSNDIRVVLRHSDVTRELVHNLARADNLSARLRPFLSRE